MAHAKADMVSKAHAFGRPRSHHQAFPNVLSGGIIGTILDCHSNWTAAWIIMQNQEKETPPCTVTAQYLVKLKKPCPTTNSVKLIANIIKSNQNKAIIKSELIAENKIVATCEGVFIAVEKGHPAFNRW